MVQNDRFPAMAGNARCIQKFRSHLRGRDRRGGAWLFTLENGHAMAFMMAVARAQNAANFARATSQLHPVGQCRYIGPHGDIATLVVTWPHPKRCSVVRVSVGAGAPPR